MPTISLDQTKNLLTNMTPGDRIELTKLPTGGFVVFAEKEEIAMTKDDILKRDYGHLMGQPITITEAVKKYDVPRQNFFDWKNSGFITVLESGYQMKLDEAEVAYCVDIYRQRKTSGYGFRGVPLLDENGLAYELKRPDVAEYRRRKNQE